MGMGVWIGSTDTPEYRRWSLYTSACATIERRGKTWWLTQFGPEVAMTDFADACANCALAHPFPPRDASDAELQSLVDGYRAAMAEWVAAMDARGLEVHASERSIADGTWVPEPPRRATGGGPARHDP